MSAERELARRLRVAHGSGEWWGTVQSLDLAAGAALVRPAGAAGDGSEDVAAFFAGSAPHPGAKVRVSSSAGQSVVVAAASGAGFAPFRTAAGAVSITPSAANTPTKADVTFPSGRFTATPRVFVTANTTGPGTVVTGCSYANATTSGCEIWLTRVNTTTTGAAWFAVQMTPSGADG